MFRSTFFPHGIQWPRRCSHLSHKHTLTQARTGSEGEALAGRRKVFQQRSRLGLVFFVVFACGLASLAWGQEGASTPQSIEAQKRAAEEVDKLNQRVDQLFQKGAYTEALEV